MVEQEHDRGQPSTVVIDVVRSAAVSEMAEEVTATDLANVYGRRQSATELLSQFDNRETKLEGEQDPRNWSAWRKWSTTAIISMMGFISPLGSAVVVPGSGMMDRHFALHSRVLSLLPVSFFVLGLGIGPFLLAPASELKGRRPIFVCSSIIFVVLNVGAALVDNFAGLCFLRFLAGAAGSTGPSLGAGSIGDMFAPRERGRAQSLYGLGPLLGPVCGAIAGGWLAQSLRSWRWLLWFLTILSGAIAVVVTLFLRETYAPVLLRRKIRAQARQQLQAVEAWQQHAAQSHNIVEADRNTVESYRVHVLSLAYPDGQRPSSSASGKLSFLPKSLLDIFVPGKELRKRTRLALTRPFRLLFLNPICAIFSLYMGFIYGIIFIFITQHPLLFERRDDPDDPSPKRLPTYGWSPGLASLTYLGLGLGFLVAASINVLLQDTIYARLVLTRGRIGWILFYDQRDIIADTAVREQREAEAAAQSTGQNEPKDLERCITTTANTISTHISVDPAANTEAATVNEKSTVAVPPRALDMTSNKMAEAAGKMSQTNAIPAAQAVNLTAQTVARAAAKGRPEYRLPLCLIGMIILPLGLLVFGWTASARTHFMLPLVGSFLVGVGTILPFQSILVYLVDAFIPYSASATACAVLVRCILAAVFPLFSEKLFLALGFGGGSSLLAGIAALAIPLPVVLFYRGEALRERFRFDG